MSLAQATLDEVSVPDSDDAEHEPTTCECCGSSDVIPHMPVSVSDSGVELSDEPRVCWDCVGSREHWQAREDTRLDEMPDEPFAAGSEWGDSR